MVSRNALFTCATLMLLLIISPALVMGAPSSHLREEVTANYFVNGSLDGGVSKIGYVEVDVENEYDVLQTINLQLSNTSGTNLQSGTSYKNVAASPYTGDRTRIYVNTTQDSQSIVYNITDPDVAAVISLRLEYQNSMGGSDIHSSGTNTFLFNLTMTTTKDVYGVITNIRFSKDTLGMNDAIDIYSVSSSSGTPQIIDSDWDGFRDIVRWQGNLQEGSEVYMTFQGNLTPDVNFDEALMMVDMDREAQSIAALSQDQTLTGITFIDRFSRGPVRQGVEMVDLGNWIARGFMKNVANSLDYIVHGWDLYRIGQSSPVLSSTEESYLNPDDKIYTDWYDTGSATKQVYYSSAFDWEVVWGSSQYSGITQSRIYLPIMYEMDFFGDKTINLDSNTQAGRQVSVTDLMRHLGHLSLDVSDVNIMSRIPGSSDTGVGASWSVSNVRVLYTNNTGQYDITSQASIATQGASPGSDGYVMVNITDLESILGHNLSQNDDIRLFYNLSGPTQSATQDYTFVTQGDFVTESGTHAIKDFNDTLTITGIQIIIGPGGVPSGYVPVALYAAIEKEFSDVRFITDEYIEINVTDRVIDTGDKGIKDIKVMIYVPHGGSLDVDEVYLSIYHSSSGFLEQWVKDKDFTIRDTGVKTIGDNRYTEYLIEKKETGTPYEEGLILFDGDKLKIGFRAKIPVGTNYILTRVFGYNYYQDKLIFEDVYTPVRREGVISRLEITEEPWVQEDAVVGKPVVWKKELTVYNPNNLSVEEIVPTPVFKDVMGIYLLEYGDGTPKRTKLKLKGSEEPYADWMAKLGGFETRIYAIEVTTPPVLETREILDVLESNEIVVRFSLNITLVNFALEDYQHISFQLFMSGDSIISILDDHGNPVEFTESDDGINILLDSMDASQTRFIYLVYEETPPVMITALETLKYQCVDSISGSILIIPGERERGAYLEMEVLGPDPSLKTVHADLIILGELREFEEKRVPIRFSTSSLGSGRYIIYTKFKKDFSTILYHQRDFVIDCPEREIITISWVVFAVVAVAIIVFLVFRIYMKRTYKKEMRELKKKIKKI